MGKILAELLQVQDKIIGKHRKETVQIFDNITRDVYFGGETSRIDAYRAAVQGLTKYLGAVDSRTGLSAYVRRIRMGIDSGELKSRKARGPKEKLFIRTALMSSNSLVNIF